MRSSLAAALLGILLLGFTPRLAYGNPEPPALPGRAAILVDARTGQVLYEQRADDRNFPASTTKLLTALVAVENADPEDLVTVGPGASGTEGSSCYLRVGEVHTLEAVLACMMVASGNDAAVAVAEHVAGTEDAFGVMMTSKAEALGAVNSRFANANGLHSETHYTTARDLSIIARAAFANPMVRRMAGAQKAVLGGVEFREFFNQNSLLWNYEGALAGKTGFTQHSLHTLVVLAERGGVQLVGVLMGFDNRQAMFRHMSDLMTYGFDAFSPTQAVTAGQNYGVVTVADGEAPLVPVQATGGLMVLTPAAGGDLGISQQVSLVDSLTAPVSAGHRVGEVVVRQGSLELGRVALVTAESVPVARTPVEAAMDQAAPFAGQVLAGAAGALVLILGLRVASVSRRRRRRLRGGQIMYYKRRGGL